MYKFKNIMKINHIQTASPLKDNQCGGCGVIDHTVTDNTCKECLDWINYDELTVSEQDALDALEYANNWIW